MPSTIYVGLAVTAKDNSALCTATFDNVNILPSAAWSAIDIGSPSIRGFTSWSNGVLTMNDASGGDICGHTQTNSATSTSRQVVTAPSRPK